MNRPLLEVKDLTVEFRLKRGTLTAVDITGANVKWFCANYFQEGL